MAVTVKRLLVYIVSAGAFLLLGNIIFISLSQKPGSSDVRTREELRRRIDALSQRAKIQAEKEKRIQDQLQSLENEINDRGRQSDPHKVVLKPPVGGGTIKPGGDSPNRDLVLPILVFSCNRATAVRQALQDLIRYRPSKEKFPIIVTQDCGHQETSDAIDEFSSEILHHIKQPDLSPIPDLTKKEKKLEGYFKISRHYKWALGQVFNTMQYETVIIMEDDLNISPDFFEYFEALYHVLKSDPTLYCVSAWNDNGKAKHIEDKPELLYRSDFFPGLGWMIQSSLWDEYRDKWPKGFWDDWLRQEEQRKERACIRPEISRTHTFGEKGVSLGLFYKQHLKFIVLNEKKIEWTTKDLSYLHKDVYDEEFVKQVYSASPIQLKDLEKAARERTSQSVRITYTDKNSFKTIAKSLDIMNDFKDGVPRTAYRGIITIAYKGIRLYITPPSDWKGYDKTWT